MTQFGTYLRTLRQGQKLSRPQVRDLIRDRFGDSFSTSSLENWENGKGYPPADDLARLVVTLKADYEEVFRRLTDEKRGVQDGHAPSETLLGKTQRPPRGGGRGGAHQKRSGSGSGGR